MITLVKKLWNDESGQGLVEYALILALVAIVVIVALTAIGTNVNTKFGEIGKGLSGTP
jgi:pilus assembly protein Flp/PilA